ncbi:iron-containing alcohol dehydrogenase family protein [Niallia sp. 03133]|uniref:iron-containing alcohol dehydrogenase family protein n=1 Tax=Niallia sp. 03133 TaxID=3458060 RepID=UPI004044CD71
MVEIEVRGAPVYYACEPGVLNELDGLLQRYNKKNCLVVHGDKSWDAISPFFPKNFQYSSLTFIPYNGECSLNEINRIAALIKENKFDAIIGIGGGKILDLAKAAGNDSNVDAVLIPTLASTCAAWTPLSVIYTDDGTFTHYSIFPKSTLMILFEPRVLLDSPTNFFIAGIADTLAKWYESDVIIRELEETPLAVTIAHQTAQLCRDVLLEHGVQAVQDQKIGHLTSALTKVMETNIVAGGMVGGYGDKYGRIAGAHSIHNALTILEETHHLLHGEKVAYGILVQLALENNWDEIRSLETFYRSLSLPLTLKDLGINKNQSEELKKVSEAATIQKESIHLMNDEITADKVLQAIYDLEAFIES